MESVPVFYDKLFKIIDLEVVNLLFYPFIITLI